MRSARPRSSQGLKPMKPVPRVAGRRAREEAEAGDGVVGADPSVCRQDGLDLLEDGARALQRGRVGQLHADERVAVVLVGHEAGGQLAAEPADSAGHAAGAGRAGSRSLRIRRAVDALCSRAVRRSKQRLKPPPRARRAAPAAAGAAAGAARQRRAERQRVERRDEHRDGDRERELLVEAPGDARP